MSNWDSCSSLSPAAFNENHFSEAIKKILLKRNDLHHVQATLKSILRDTLQGKSCQPNLAKPKDIQMLEKLILEYLEWFGFKYTGETFAIESETAPKFSQAEMNRLKLQEVDKDVPILLQVIMKRMAKELDSGAEQ